MKKHNIDKKSVIKSFVLFCVLSINMLPINMVSGTVAGATVIKEAASEAFYNITPDYLEEGTNEELDQITFHELLLPYDGKEEGITVALPVSGRGRIHYDIGVKNYETASIIEPEIYKDAACTIPVENHYESDEVYDYFYYFNVPEGNVYFMKLRAPEYDKEEDLQLKLSVQYYNGEDRTLMQSKQAFTAVVDEEPTNYEIAIPGNGTVTITTDNYDTEEPTIIALYDKDGNKIKKTDIIINDTVYQHVYHVNAGIYTIKATNQTDFYRISYYFERNTEPEDFPKTGDSRKPYFYVSYAGLFGGLALLLKFKK